MSSSTPADPAPFIQPSGRACRRSSLPPWLRMAIFFGVLFPLKYALPLTGLAEAAQVIALVSVATALVAAFWFACGEGRRGGLILVGMLWLAALVKIAT